MSPSVKFAAVVVVVVVLLGAFVWTLATSKSRMQFREEAVIEAPPETVKAAVRAFATETLAGFSLHDAPDGWTGSGVLGMHLTDITLRIEPSGTGAKVTMQLDVLRSSSAGYMLFDVGSFYGRHLRKWLDDVKGRATTPAK